MQYGTITTEPQPNGFLIQREHFCLEGTPITRTPPLKENSLHVITVLFFLFSLFLDKHLELIRYLYLANFEKGMFLDKQASKSNCLVSAAYFSPRSPACLQFNTLGSLWHPQRCENNIF